MATIVSGENVANDGAVVQDSGNEQNTVQVVSECYFDLFILDRCQTRRVKLA